MAADRSADRHDPAKQTGMSVRLDNPDFARLDATWKRLGLRSRRQAVVTAIREWVAKYDPETTETTKEQQWPPSRLTR